jgi:hypothetical protein
VKLPEAIDDNIIGKEPVSGQNLYSVTVRCQEFLHSHGLRHQGLVILVLEGTFELDRRVETMP